jgi:hypothetical protein
MQSGQRGQHSRRSRAVAKAIVNRSGRSTAWVKTKNPAAPAVRREAEEEWH